MSEWVQVPVEPTDEMLIAAKAAWDSADEIWMSDVYKAMLAAAPRSADELAQFVAAQKRLDPDDMRALRDVLRESYEPIAEPANELARLEWQPIETAPKDGSAFTGRVIDTRPYRWKAYKLQAARQMHKAAGRWQRMNDYGGWDNSELPQDWMPLPEPPKESGDE